jgi:hypothetical protein
MFKELYHKIESMIFIAYVDRKIKKQTDKKLADQLQLEEDMKILKKIAPNVFSEEE